MAKHAIIDEISFDNNIEIETIEDIVTSNLADFGDIIDNYTGTFGGSLWADNKDFY